MTLDNLLLIIFLGLFPIFLAGYLLFFFKNGLSENLQVFKRVLSLV